MKKKNLIITTALAAIMLAGCNAGENATNNTTRVGGTVDAGLSRLGDRNNLRAGGSQFSEGIFVGASPERNNAALLPSRLQSSGAVRLESRDALTLNEISQRLSEITGIPHVLALGPTGRVTSSGADLRTASDIIPAMPDASAPTTSVAPPAPQMQPNAAGGEITMRPNLKGTLSEVLDQITGAFDVEWSYSEGRVMFRDYVTRKYQISALPGTSSSSSSIGANSISADSALASDVWGEVEVALNGIVSEGSTVAMGATTGMVTVTAKVSDQNRVAEYIKQMNGVIGQQVSFDVNIFTVSLSDENSSGIDLRTALSGTSGNVDYNGAIGSNGAVGTVNIGLIRGDVSINAIVQALSTQGKVSVSTRAGATTSNNRVAPINVIDKTAYLKEVSITTDDSGNDRLQRTPAEVETGFQMQLFPRVLNNREIMVQFTVRLSELNNMAVFGDGNEAVQLPEVSTTSFEQQAVLENGQTLILAGFERQRAEVENRASGRGLGGFGGGKSAKTSRVATVMMITPRIINRR